MFQSYALFPNLSVADNVAYGLVNRKVAKAHGGGARRRAAEAGRPARQRRQVSRPSSRAASSSASRSRARSPPRRACCCSTSRCRRSTRSSACACAARSARCSSKLGVTTIMVTHDQEEALSMADRIVVMNQGVIEQIGTPMEIYRDPATPFVADFVGKINVLLGAPASGPRPAHRHEPLRVRARHRAPSATSRSTCGRKTCWRGRSRRATPTSSTARSTRSSSSARTACVRVQRRGDRRAADHGLPVAQLPRRAGARGRQPAAAASSCPSGCASSSRVAVGRRPCPPSSPLPAAARAAPARRTGATASPTRALLAIVAGAGRLPGAAAGDDPRQGVAGQGRRVRRPRQLRELPRHAGAAAVDRGTASGSRRW